MAETLFIEGGRVIDPANRVDAVRTVVVRDGKIAEVAERVERPRDARTLDARGRSGGDPDIVRIYKVPGSFEIPLGAKRLATSGKYDAVVCLGAVIRGCTPHFEYVASEVSKGGLEVLKAKDDTERALFARDLDCPLGDEYFKRFIEALGSHPDQGSSADEARRTAHARWFR